MTTEQVFALWQTLGELTNDPAIGLKLADQVPVAKHHPASIAAHHARNFRDGLQRMARYKLLCCSEEMRMTERAGECVLEFSWLLSRERVPPLLLDAAFASMLQLGRRGTGVTIWPLRVELRQAPEYREIRERCFGCPIKFKASRNAIVFLQKGPYQIMRFFDRERRFRHVFTVMDQLTSDGLDLLETALLRFALFQAEILRGGIEPGHQERNFFRRRGLSLGEFGTF